MKQLIQLIVLASLLELGGCSTFKYAKQTKLIALSNDIARGPSIGPIEGRDCHWTLFGIKFSGVPTLDRAIQDALSRTHLDSFIQNSESTGTTPVPTIKIRYINNISTANDGYNLGLIEKKCLVLSGVGHL